MRTPVLLAALTVLTLAPVKWAIADTLVDLELVMAVDGSASVDAGEYQLQMQGIARAIRDKQVVETIQAGKTGRIAIALVVWADATVPKNFLSWHLIDGQAAANRFADRVARFPRRVRGGTGIGAGVAEAIRMFERNAFQSRRQVVDVSGDGTETPPREVVLLMGHARAMAMARNVVINGLAIENEVRDLSAWYRSNVITGRNAFVVTVSDYADFARAMKAKLIREIENLPPVSLVPGPGSTLRYSCNCSGLGPP